MLSVVPVWDDTRVTTNYARLCVSLPQKLVFTFILARLLHFPMDAAPISW